MMNNTNQKGRKFFFVLYAVIAFLAFWLLKDYWKEIVLAFTTALILQPYFKFLQRKFKFTQSKANIAVLISTILFIFIPFITLGYRLLVDAFSLRAKIGQNLDFGELNIESVLEQVNNYLAKIPVVSYSVDIAQLQEWLNTTINFVSSFIIDNFSVLLGSVTNFMVSVFIFFLLLYFLVPSFGKFFSYLKDLSPMDDKIDEYFFTKAKAMTIDMLKGTVIIGIVQSVIGGITLWFFGLNYIITLTVVMIVFSMIPVIGTSFVLVPIAVGLLLTGNIWAGVIVILVQALIISSVDNVLRPMLVSDKAKLHPALVILGVIGGLGTMGMLGVIYGPVIIILFVTASEVYRKHYR